MHKKIYLSPPHMSGREQHYISEAFRSNWIAPLGPLVNSFEEQLAERVGVKAAAAVRLRNGGDSSRAAFA